MPEILDNEKWWMLSEITREYDLGFSRVINEVRYHQTVPTRVVGKNRFVKDSDVQTLVDSIRARFAKKARRAEESK